MAKLFNLRSKRSSILKKEKGETLLKTRKKNINALLSSTKQMFSLGVKYILTYKFCQYFIETYFAAIRSKNEWNFKPSLYHFHSSFHQLFLHAQLDIVLNGNVSLQYQT